MSVQQKNEYTVRFMDQSQTTVVATDMGAVTKLYETADKPITQITRVRTLDDIITDPATGTWIGGYL